MLQILYTKVSVPSKLVFGRYSIEPSRFTTTEPLAGANSIVEAAKAAQVPYLLIVGGAGSLYAAPDLQVVDTPDFPKAIYDGANAARHLLTALLPRRDVNWSFVSPPARLGADSGFSEDKTGKYRLGKDDLLMDGEIPAGISVADLAVAIADDVENKAHLFERFTVAAA